ncbi:methyltransferase [Massilia solisilvae]|uniref:Methyltransferase n=1 Tax=Massilia solisilvae TaxID=1811225 RepID=A0ABT2BJP8_9BURK|nr:CheR family methyltransferase [Massilia solisilvae]MCS0608741.1 methyltransferase [Massilia solisilvae]
MNAHDILLRETGLDLDAATLERALRERMECLGIAGRAEYLALLAGPELHELAELVVVPESWMFRDPAAFKAAVSHVTAQLARHPGHVARILSVPCAGGEEPYSMAMALHDAGVPPASWRIDAIDLSAASVARARAGHYTRNAFRGAGLGFRDRHFSQDGGGYLLREDIRAHVHISQGNLFALDMAANAGRYDVVFCRNLLIYFDDAGIARAANILGRLLSHAGMLLAGPAEAPVLCRHGFAQLPLAGAFALHKQGCPPAIAAAARPRQGLRTIAPVPLKAAPRPAAPPLPAAAPATPELLALARRQADGGQLREAAATCQALIARAPDEPDAHFILGLVSQCQRDARSAERHLRQCLYLAPRHYDALCALALLAEEAGEPAQAAIYRQRAARSHAGADGSRAA